jgi:Protein of unknown function (DUF2628)
VSAKDFSDTKPVGLYESAIGDKNQDYYLGKFEDFDDKGPGLHASWNWAAFFIPVFWVLYRKMYGWFVVWVCIFIFFGVADRAALNSAEGSYWVLAATFAVAVSFSAYANSLYHRKVKARIATAQKSSSDASRLSRKLTAGGGVNKWVPLVCGAVPVIGVVAAIALPAYHDYTKRQEVGAIAVQVPVSAEKPIAYGVNDYPAQQVKNVNPFSDPNFGKTDPIAAKKPFTYDAAVGDQQLSADKQFFKSQGIGGNQDLADVATWGDTQIFARISNDLDFRKAHSAALMWQRQILLKMPFSPERALFLGFMTVVNNYDEKKWICRPDMTRNGGVNSLPDGKFEVFRECFFPE